MLRVGVPRVGFLRVNCRALIAAPPVNTAPLPHPGCDRVYVESTTNSPESAEYMPEISDGRPTIGSNNRVQQSGNPSTGPRPMGYETLTNVSPMSRRAFFAATTSVVGGALVAACAPDPPSPPDTKSVLIVGAGMAGLSAARSLADAG